MSTVYCILDSEKFNMFCKKFPETIKTLNDTGVKKGTQYFCFKGINIFEEGGELHFSVDLEKLEHIETALKETILQYSIRESIHIKREQGVYVNKTAQAEVEYYNDFTKVAIQGTKFDDVVELRNKIFAGSVRPSESWDRPQNGLSNDDANAEIELLRAEVESLKSENSEQLKTIQHQAGRITSALTDLYEANRGSFFANQKLVLKAIKKLDS